MKPQVAVLKTQPDSVINDYQKLLQSVHYEKYLDQSKETALKINISWHHWYPACSTTPWQLEGVITTLLKDAFSAESIYGCHNRTVVVSAKRGEIANKHKKVIEKYGLRNIHLYENEEWIRYEPKGKLLVLHKIFPRGIYIPKRFFGCNIIHLPTMKTHVFTVMTGAMKNAFGGLLHEKRHWTHADIHKTLVDLLLIQKEIHSGIFAVTDGTFTGDGPGPRCMRVIPKGYILASNDQVAIDAVSAKMMGFDPMRLQFIRLAHESGLGCGDLKNIEIVGEDISPIDFGFKGNMNTFASQGQKMIYWGPLKPLEKYLLRSLITPWSYLASFVYHDIYWYNFIGRKRIKEALKTSWGKLFLSY
ncbi:DUF362 domain-containing protein [Chlamydiota bacterium]